MHGVAFGLLSLDPWIEVNYMRTRVMVCLAFAMGIILGVVLSRPRAVRADAQVIVRRVELQANQSHVFVSGDVVGFACLRSSAGAPAECYIASR